MLSALEERSDTVRKLLTRDEVAAMLGVTVRHLIRMTAPKGPLPCIKIGRRLMFDPLDVAAYIQARRIA